MGQFYKTLKEELTPILLRLFQKSKKREDSLYGSIILISKPDKDRAKKENYRAITLMNIDEKILNKIWQIISSNT